MPGRHQFSHIIVVLFFVVVLFLVGGMEVIVTAQTQIPMMIQVTAMGTSTQLGQIAQVNISIEHLSTEDDRKTLIDAFNRSGQSGLVDVLEDMKEKGRVSSLYGTGNEIKYIFELPPDKGRRHLRLITNRRLAFVETRNSTRSEQYSVGAIDLFLTSDGTSSEGTALPACRLTVNKKKQIEIETFQNPWKLTNFMISKL